MKNFEIKFKGIEKLKGNNLDIESSGELSIYFNGQLLQNPWAKEKGREVGYTDTEYRYDFFLTLLSEAKKFDENPHMVDFLDNPLRFYFKRTKDKVELKFGVSKGTARDKLVFFSNVIGQTTLNYLDFLNEVLTVTGEFIGQILKINPTFRNYSEVEKFFGERKQVEELYKRIKNEV